MKSAKRNSAIIFATLLLFLGNASNAQILGRPKVLSAFDSTYGYVPPYFSTLYKKGGGEIPWVVYADRNGTHFFHDEQCNKPKGQSAKFMQRFFVKNISGNGRALFLVDATLQPRLSDAVVNTNYGWVKTDELLLANTAYRDPKTHICRKALITMDYRFLFDAGGQSDDLMQIKHAVLYDRPSIEATPVKTVGFSNFGYVYKTIEKDDHEWYLISDEYAKFYLGIDHEMQKKEKTFGWVRDDQAHIWNTRQAFEPLPGRSMPVHIYETAIDLINEDSSGILFKDLMRNEEWEISRFRYPLLDLYERGFAWKTTTGMR